MRRFRWLALAAVVALAVVAAATAVQLLRPLPSPSVRSELPASYTVSGVFPALPWPSTGQAAIFLKGTGWVGRTPGQSPVAIASTTKLMTAEVVLRAHPLSVGESGPQVTITAADQDLYREEMAEDDSVVTVVTGERLSELQLLEGLLLPSGDNLAVVLADWDAGSEPAFVSLMNSRARELGMTQTHYADSSGLDSGSVSTASDLSRLALAVMAEPVLAQIVAMKEVVLPVAGVVRNYDFVLGEDGLVGIKTGWTSAAGGCFVFAATRAEAGGTAELVGAVLGQPGNATGAIELAEGESVALLAASWPALEVVHPLVVGERLGELRSAWRSGVAIRAAGTVSVLGWPGLRFDLRFRGLRPRPPVPAGDRVGRVEIHAASGLRQTVVGVTAASLPRPSLAWRLTRS